jgi:hypothetical protein
MTKSLRKSGKKETQQEKKRRLIARRIAKYIFTDGTGQKAGRLVMEMPGHRYVASGWSRSAVECAIEGALKNFTIFYGGRK